MAKVKLELALLSDVALRDFATNHKTMISTAPGSTHFPTPQPPPATVDPAMTSFGAKLAEITSAEGALATLRAQKDELRRQVEELLNQRSSYVQQASAGDEAKILSVGFQVQAAAVPTSSMAKPENMVASIGDNDGEVDLSCNGVRKAKVYIWECRTHEEAAVPGAWQQIKMGSRSSYTATGLVSGKKYAFRVKVVGPNDLQSPWSDEAVAMAG